MFFREEGYDELVMLGERLILIHTLKGSEAQEMQLWLKVLEIDKRSMVRGKLKEVRHCSA